MDLRDLHSSLFLVLSSISRSHVYRHFKDTKSLIQPNLEKVFHIIYIYMFSYCLPKTCLSPTTLHTFSRPGGRWSVPVYPAPFVGRFGPPISAPLRAAPHSGQRRARRRARRRSRWRRMRRGRASGGSVWWRRRWRAWKRPEWGR